MSKIFALLLYLLLMLGAVLFAFFTYLTFREETRGVGFDAPVTPKILGTNVALEDDPDPARQLALVTRAGFIVIRQHFYWREIEATRGSFDWSQWDTIVNAATQAHLSIIAVLDTAPAWSQRPHERTIPNAPPDNFDDYARFVTAFVQRYGDKIDYYQIGDQPNVHPDWGDRNADPKEYAQLLHAASVVIRANDPSAKILLAGLALNNEMEHLHPDYNEVAFLSGIYAAGARNDFDIVAAKPYGMWTGPEDRKVTADWYNFSRVILLREEMQRQRDDRPIWAVEFGWNALPANWTGKPSPWGTDTEEVQSSRLVRSIERAQSEWQWLEGMIYAQFLPNAPGDDPVWGFSLVDKNLQPRASYDDLARVIASPAPPPPHAASGNIYLVIAILAVVALVAVWRAGVLALQLPLHPWWNVLETNFARLPEPAQFAILLIAVAAFYWSPKTILNFALLVLLVPLFALRLDFGLMLAIFTIPFFLYPKNLVGGARFSMVEVLTLVSVVAWGVKRILNFEFRISNLRASLATRLSSLDWAVVAFVVLGFVSTQIAANFGVANREWRVIVIEPALMYFLLRVGGFSARDHIRFVNAFIASGLGVALIGLLQFFVTGDVIVAGELRRIHAVWASPNNAALFLGRVAAMVVVFALFYPHPSPPPQSRGGSIGRRIIYAGIAAVVLLALYLTYSRGTWLLGLPATLVFVGLMRGGRTRWVVAALLGASVLALVPLAGTERFQSLFQEGTGTGFFRISVWKSAVAMIRDHPLFGVGLDNFLYEYPKYILPEAWREPNLSHPHNILLDVWTRLGVFGVVVLGWMLVEFFRVGIRVYRGGAGENLIRVVALGLMSVMVYTLAHGLIDHAVFLVDLSFIFFAMLALIQLI